MRTPSVQTRSTSITPAKGIAAPSGSSDGAPSDGVMLLTLDGRLDRVGSGARGAMKTRGVSAAVGSLWSSLWPEAQRGLVDRAVTRAARGEVARLSMDGPTAAGRWKRWELMVCPVPDPIGRPAHLLVVSRDVTDAVVSARQDALVARELAHRLSNLFTVVDGVIALSARTEQAVDAFAAGLRDRLRGLARGVALLQSNAGTSGGGPGLRALLADLLTPYGGVTGEQLDLDGDEVVLPVEAVTPLALAISELATNAIKYGAWSSPGGRVLVRVVRGGSGCEIRWTELGDRAAKPSPAKGFGTTLLDRAIRLQLGGTVDRRWTPRGLCLTLALPLGGADADDVSPSGGRGFTNMEGDLR